MKETPAVKLTPTQTAALDLLKNGWRIVPSEYRGRFGTSAAYAIRHHPDGSSETAKVTQGTIDALKRKGLVREVGMLRERRVELI